MHLFVRVGRPTYTGPASAPLAEPFPVLSNVHVQSSPVAGSYGHWSTQDIGG